jgi:glucose-fructose oxidoreductase
MILEVKVGSHTQRKLYALRDQFAPELIYFSDCILHGREPEPSGLEGLRDVRIIQSLYESVRTKAPMKLEPIRRRQYPTLKQAIYRPRVAKPKLVHVTAPKR